MKLSGIFVFAVFLAATGASSLRAAPCENLASLSLPQAKITSAQTVASGTFVMPLGRGIPIKNLPAFCRVAATLTPTSDSDIKIEVWMPVEGWNGKFMSVGNSGITGEISYPQMIEPLQRGYAVASTDTGHVGDDAKFAMGHPEKLVDFGYRSAHEMTVKGKLIVAAYYGNAAKRSYWFGCSTGGRQGLMEAQRFPDDFDGIVAGAPANNTAHLIAASLWIALAVHKDEASYIPPEKYPLIHNAVLEKCDTIDGLKDGILDDPRKCKFDPKELQCKDADAPTCLTAAQVDAARKIYSPVINPRTKAEIFPALERGSELGWAVKAGPKLSDLALGQWRYFVFNNPDWDYKTFNFDSDVAAGDRGEKDIIATDPNIGPFLKRGGKLLQYHGWSDQMISPENSIHYYESVVHTLGQKNIDGSYRLFMVPGMGHCGGGSSPNRFDSVAALEQWVEKEEAPKQIIGTEIHKEVTVRTRPLCPYPQVAVYKGSGSSDDAANFSCAAPK